MKYTLAEIADINKFSISKSDNLQEIIYLDTSSITENFISGTCIMPLSEAPSRAQRKVKSNTIVYSTVRPRLKHYGILNSPPYNLIVSSGFVTIDLKKEYEDRIDARYLFLLLTQPAITEYIACIADSAVSAYPSFNPSDISEIAFSFPNIEKQKAISEIWSNFEQKISINRQINDNLEAMAKQLYDYWFVQFDFPNEEGKPYKSSGGAMVWNDKMKREIPQGWGTQNLADCLKLKTERVNSKDIKDTDNYTPIEVIPRKQMSLHETVALENAMSGICRYSKRNILLSNRRVYFHKVCIAPFDGLTRDTVLVLEPYNSGNLGYLYETVFADEFILFATKHSYGSEQPVLSWTSAQKFNVLRPSNTIDKKYSEIVDSIIDSVLNNQIEIIKLTKQRDELLPLLMNGQASVNYHLFDD